LLALVLGLGAWSPGALLLLPLRPALARRAAKLLLGVGVGVAVGAAAADVGAAGVAAGGVGSPLAVQRAALSAGAGPV